MQVGGWVWVKKKAKKKKKEISEYICIANMHVIQYIPEKLYCIKKTKSNHFLMPDEVPHSSFDDTGTGTRRSNKTTSAKVRKPIYRSSIFHMNTHMHVTRQVFELRHGRMKQRRGVGWGGSVMKKIAELRPNRTAG